MSQPRIDAPRQEDKKEGDRVLMTAADRSTVMAEAVSTVSLARDLHRYGRHKAAEALFLQATEHVERILGAHDPALANILDAYMEFLVSLRREADAAPVRDRSNQIRKQAKISA